MTAQRPTPPIELTGTASRWGDVASLPDEWLDELRAVSACDTDEAAVADASRDWWPLAMHWALDGEVPRRAAVVCRPTTTAEVAGVAAWCHRRRVPLTVAAGRSGVSGGSVPVFGGVVVDLCGLQRIRSVDAESGLVEVEAGTFGPVLEAALTDHGLTVGHFPQSFELSTVGGWVACRGAGQFSTRYGKIEQMVVGLEVVLADGSVVTLGGSPAAATGPDLVQLFTGSEGTLGIITAVTLRAHPLPAAQREMAFRVASFGDGIAACRDVVRRGATPAVLRLYDEVETARSHGGDGTWCALLVLDRGDPAIVEATMAVVGDVLRHVDGHELGPDPVDAWLAHRNDTSALQALTRKGIVVDTMEVAAPWSVLSEVHRATTAALLSVPGARVASCHLSHSYLDGACVYFTFAATPTESVESTYVALWDAGQRAALAAGANLSHHHGVGVNRGRFMREYHGSAMNVLEQIKAALDPYGILNPGKLGLSAPEGTVPWP